MSTELDRILRYGAVDEDGIYMGSKDCMYRHKYLKINRESGMPEYKTATSNTWRSEKTPLTAREFMNKYSDQSYEIRITETKVFR